MIDELKDFFCFWKQRDNILHKTDFNQIYVLMYAVQYKNVFYFV